MTRCEHDSRKVRLSLGERASIWLGIAAAGSAVVMSVWSSSISVRADIAALRAEVGAVLQRVERLERVIDSRRDR